VRTFFRPAGATTLLHLVPRTNVRGYILALLRGSRMMALFHRRLDFCVLTQSLPSLVKTFFRPAGAMNLPYFAPRTYVRGYILALLRGSRMTVLFHRRLDFCVLTQKRFWCVCRSSILRFLCNPLHSNAFPAKLNPRRYMNLSIFPNRWYGERCAILLNLPPS
jgi:hypothetical protein